MAPMEDRLYDTLTSRPNALKNPYNFRLIFRCGKLVNIQLCLSSGWRAEAKACHRREPFSDLNTSLGHELIISRKWQRRTKIQGDQIVQQIHSKKMIGARTYTSSPGHPSTTNTSNTIPSVVLNKCASCM